MKKLYFFFKKLVSDNDGWTLRWEPMWKHCTPCVEGYPYQFIVKIEHIDEDLDYIMHDVLNIRNATDNTPLKIQSYWDDEAFDVFRNKYPRWIFDGFAKDNMEVVQRYYELNSSHQIRNIIYTRKPY